MACIQNKYPTFRHNDLKPNNILIYPYCTKDNSNNQYIDKYSIKSGSKLYIVPQHKYTAKIWDFDFACIKGQYTNSKVQASWTDKFNIFDK